MKWIKYTVAILCVLTIIGTLPPTYMIAKGLLVGSVDDPAYFGRKLFIYLAMIVGLGFMSFKLVRSARRQ
jgi:hypothetical protein